LFAHNDDEIAIAAGVLRGLI